MKQRYKGFLLGVVFGQRAFGGVGFVFKQNALVRDFAPAGVELFNLNFGFFVVLRLKAYSFGLYPEVYVFCDKKYLLALFLQQERDAQQSVVNLRGHKSVGQVGLVLKLNNKRAAAFKLDAFKKPSFGSKGIKHPGYQAGASASFVVEVLKAVKLLNHSHGNDYLIISERVY